MARHFLVAIALAGVFIAIDRFALAYALLGAIAAAVAFAETDGSLANESILRLEPNG